MTDELIKKKQYRLGIFFLSLQNYRKAFVKNLTFNCFFSCSRSLLLINHSLSLSFFLPILLPLSQFVFFSLFLSQTKILTGFYLVTDVRLFNPRGFLSSHSFDTHTHTLSLSLSLSFSLPFFLSDNLPTAPFPSIPHSSVTHTNTHTHTHILSPLILTAHQILKHSLFLFLSSHFHDSSFSGFNTHTHTPTHTHTHTFFSFSVTLRLFVSLSLSHTHTHNHTHTFTHCFSLLFIFLSLSLSLSGFCGFRHCTFQIRHSIHAFRRPRSNFGFNRF